MYHKLSNWCPKNHPFLHLTRESTCACTPHSAIGIWHLQKPHSYFFLLLNPQRARLFLFSLSARLLSPKEVHLCRCQVKRRKKSARCALSEIWARAVRSVRSVPLLQWSAWKRVVCESDRERSLVMPSCSVTLNPLFGRRLLVCNQE